VANEFQPRKAQKHSVKLKMAIQGPSGSGKTEGALALAKNFVPNAKILVVDTENESASLYADRYDFDTIPLSAPYTSDRYRKAMQAAVEGGYDVLIVDSLTQQWDGEGGILRRKEALDRQPGSNSYTNWSTYTPEHTAFVEFIKQLPIHTICTLRTKQEYVLETNAKGKQQPRKVGMAPIQRDGLEYEFTIVFEVGMSHQATASKNRTNLFADDEPINLTSEDVASKMREWLANGVTVPAIQPLEAKSETLFRYDAPNLTCQPVDAELRKSKGKDPKDFIALKLNGECEGKRLAFCWHKSMFAPLLASIGKTTAVVVELSGDYLNISEVITVEGFINPEPATSTATEDDEDCDSHGPEDMEAQ